MLEQLHLKILTRDALSSKGTPQQENQANVTTHESTDIKYLQNNAICIDSLASEACLDTNH
jgi:hypothetical protein